MATLTGLGLRVELPGGWDGRIYGREVAGGTRAALHAGTFPLPGERGDFGSGAVDVMGSEDVLIVLLEYDPACTAQPLFQAEGPPGALEAEAFSPTVLQRSLPGQAGSQSFFSTGGRAFCLYVVLGQFANRSRLVPVANRVLARIAVEA